MNEINNEREPENEGGDLMANDAFKDIISIGFEFETHNLSKFSLHENQKFLINTNTTMYILKNKLEDQIASKHDANNYIMWAHLDEFNDDASSSSSLSSIDSNLTEELNADFLEYMIESRPGDDKNTRFNLTNDIAQNRFSNYLKNRCSDSAKKIPKNKLYTVKTIEGKKSKEYELKFVEMDDCFIFSGLEVIVTYLKPRARNPNIILEMFGDACSRILDHFSDLTKTRCNLYLHDINNGQHKIGNVESRYLYHKPGTNLYYLQTYDEKNTFHKKSLGESIFIPQMTMRVYAWNAIEVMYSLLKHTKKQNYTKHRKYLNQILDELSLFKDVLEVVNNLIFSYNAKTKRKISIETRAGKSIQLYLFLIIMKLYLFSHVFLSEVETNSKLYLKDFLAFLPRHSNYVMYLRIKQIMRTQFRIVDKTAIKDVLSLIYQPEVLFQLFSEPDEKNAIQNIFVSKGDEDYGNPNVSFISYFHYFENPEEDTEDEELESSSVSSHESLQILMNLNKYSKNDWLKMHKYDIYSTEYPLVKDAILFENRLFARELYLYMKNKINDRMSILNVKNMKPFTLNNKKPRNKTVKKRS
jgi:hypothetical protein